MTATALRVETKANGYRTYWHGEHELRSVTTAISQGAPKPALVGWAAKCCGEFAAANLDQLNSLVGPRGGKQLVLDMVKRAPDREKAASAGVGTLLHDTAEAWLTDRAAPEVTADTAPFVASLKGFFDVWQPEPVEVECAIFNLTHAYAGRADLFCKLPGLGVCLLDWKTTKPGRQGHGIYPETALQLNAYAAGEFLLTRDGEGKPMPAVDALVGVNVRPEGTTVVPVERSRRVLEVFLAVCEVATFTHNGGQFLGQPLPPPGPRPIDEWDRMALLTRIGKLSAEHQGEIRADWLWGSLKAGAPNPVMAADLDAVLTVVNAYEAEERGRS